MARNFSKLTCGNHAEFLVEGERYYNFYVELIDQAQSSIHLQTYIFEMDDFGQRVHQALIAAAQRGVKIYVLLDSVGGKRFSTQNEDDLIQQGIHFKRFNGLHFKWLYQWGRRLHHKILLVDHRKAIVGGINVTTSGYGYEHKTQQLDFAVFLEGPILYELTLYCQHVYRKAFSKPIVMEDVIEQNPSLEKLNNHVDLSVSINDWVYRRWQIAKQYSKITQIAKHNITIVNSYFFPRRKFMRELVAAAKRGVRVRLILPALSDWPSYILASQYLYSYFLKNGIEIYQWKKSVLHGKMATVDNQFATVGSFNLNYTSYQQNLEMNVDISSPSFVKELNSVVQEIIEVGCEQLDPKDFIERTSLRTRFLRFFFYIILSLIANFSISLTYQEASVRGPQNYSSLIRIVAATIFLILGIMGAILPVIPGLPFLIISFLLVYRQLIFNKKNGL